SIPSALVARCGQVLPKSKDLKTSAWSGTSPPFRLPSYTAPELSTFSDVSPLPLCAMPPAFQLEPPLNERKKLIPLFDGYETYRLPSGPEAIDGSPPPSFGATLTTESLIGAADAGTTPTAAANPANMTTTDSLR